MSVHLIVLSLNKSGGDWILVGTAIMVMSRDGRAWWRAYMPWAWTGPTHANHTCFMLCLGDEIFIKIAQTQPNSRVGSGLCFRVYA